MRSWKIHFSISWGGIPPFLTGCLLQLMFVALFICFYIFIYAVSVWARAALLLPAGAFKGISLSDYM